MIIDHNNLLFRQRWEGMRSNRYNGAYYYSKEIVDNIIPNVKTDRDWITVNVPGQCRDGAIIFVHNNLQPEHYNWLKGFKDLVIVCGVPETMEKVKHLGMPIYLPLSVNVDYVKQFKTEKTKEAAFVGRKSKRDNLVLPNGIDFIEDLPRPELLKRMAEYKEVYAVGRCAIEAKILGCKVKPYDPRYPKTSRWKVLDNKDAAKILQGQLDALDHPHIINPSHPRYQLLRTRQKSGQHNGAYYYALEIAKNIIPNVQTNRPWDTLGMRRVGSLDHAIVFIHHGINQDKVYSWLNDYKDQILVCSTQDTYDWAVSKGKKAIFLPLSIDVEYVKKFRAEKTKKACYAGNRWAFKEEDTKKYVPEDVDFPPHNLPREKLLKFIAQYKECYAIGRCAIEAKVLGCKLKVCYHKYPDPRYWKILDNKDAAKILQQELNKLDNIRENNNK